MTNNPETGFNPNNINNPDSTRDYLSKRFAVQFDRKSTDPSIAEAAAKTAAELEQIQNHPDYTTTFDALREQFPRKPEETESAYEATILATAVRIIVDKYAENVTPDSLEQSKQLIASTENAIFDVLVGKIRAAGVQEVDEGSLRQKVLEFMSRVRSVDTLKDRQETIKNPKEIRFHNWLSREAFQQRTLEVFYKQVLLELGVK